MNLMRRKRKVRYKFYKYGASYYDINDECNIEHKAEGVICARNYRQAKETIKETYSRWGYTSPKYFKLHYIRKCPQNYSYVACTGHQGTIITMKKQEDIPDGTIILN